MLASVHFSGTVHVAPIFKRTRNHRVWVQFLVSLPTISRNSKDGWLEESALIPVSCFRNAGEQAKGSEVGEKSPSSHGSVGASSESRTERRSTGFSTMPKEFSCKAFGTLRSPQTYVGAAAGG
jgi:hypothetical protein